MRIARRKLLATAAASALPMGAWAADKVLKFVPSSDLAGLDPIWTTAYVVRNHGYMVYETLFASDAEFVVRTQMAEGSEISSDGLTCTIWLRDGLRFHDNTPVRAQDCVASIRRWSARDGLGQALMAATADLTATDDRTVRFRLKTSFPLLVPALGKLSAPVPFMMPERVAATDPNTQIRDATGSGSFRFLADEWVQGSRAVYAKFTGYVPRNEPASGLAGGKQVNVDRVEWMTIPDPSTAMSALRTNAVDWFEAPPFDLLPLVGEDPTIVVEVTDTIGYPTILRFNHIYPPFNNVKRRRALLAAVQQAPYLQAAVGNSKFYQECKSFFPCGTPLSSDAGSEVMTGDLDLARRMLGDSGYAGERTVLLAATDNQILHAESMVTFDLLKRLGMNMELVEIEWASLVQRRAKPEPVDQGGWSLFHTSAASVEYMSPASHLGLRADGRAAWFGWPSDPRLEELRKAWTYATDDNARRKIAADVQQEAFSSVPYVPLGQYSQPTAYRRSLTGIVRSSVPVAWNLKKNA